MSTSARTVTTTPRAPLKSLPAKAPRINEAAALRAFDALLDSAKAVRFRVSDLSTPLYELTTPRSRALATQHASKLMAKAKREGRIEREGLQHWKAAAQKRYRKLLDGTKINETSSLTKLKLNTRVPSKWVAVDLETGELWEGSATGWWRASPAKAACAEIAVDAHVAAQLAEKTAASARAARSSKAAERPS